MVKIIEYQKSIMEGFKLLENENTIFIGQNIISAGCPLQQAMRNINRDKMIELPIIEDTQMGMSIGLSLDGLIPVSIYPRLDFMMCAINQLVNHLDKVTQMSRGEFKQGIIIITQLGNTKPLDPGPQHCGNYSKALKCMLKHTIVLNSKTPKDDMEYALKRAKDGLSTLIITKPTGRWKA